jgi:hypothetical protein
MANLFGLEPGYFLAGPYWRWVRFKAWADDYQRQQAKGGE